MLLRYIGNGSWLPGVPARDLSDQDVKSGPLSEAELVASGLYEKVHSTPKGPSVSSGSETRMKTGGSENKSARNDEDEESER